MPSLDFDKEKQAFRDWYESNSGLLKRALTTYRVLLSQLFADHPTVAPPVVTGRIKARDECVSKFSRKYQAKCEQEQKPYEIRPFLTDIVGLRIVCLYESDVTIIRDAVVRQFDVVEETNKTASIEAHDDTFGYKGLHLDLQLNDSRLVLPEYASLKGIPFELQIRTTVQDAWSVLDHKIKYKKSIPDSLRRRINRLAALFELADQEFQNIRNETWNLEQPPGQAARTATGPVPAGPSITPEPEPPLNAFTFLQLATAQYSKYSFDAIKVDGFVVELRTVDSELTSSQLNAILTSQLPTIEEYRKFQHEQHHNNLNPFTCIRHALYRFDKVKFKAILFNSQRAAFDKWLEEQGTTQPLATHETDSADPT